MKAPVTAKFNRVWNKVSDFLAQHGVELSLCRLQVNPDLGEDVLAMYRPPDRIIAKPDVPESVLAHELVHAAQRTLEVFRGFKHLYSVFSEGLAEFVAKRLYSEHEIKYPVSYRVVSSLYAVDRGIVKEIIELDNFKLVPRDIDTFLKSPKVHAQFKKLIRRQRVLLKENIRRAIQSKISDPTFISLGEDLRAWKFLLLPKLDPVREQVNALLHEYFRGEEEG